MTLFTTHITIFLKNGWNRYTPIAFDHDIPLDHELIYCVKTEPKAECVYTKNEVTSILEFLIENIFLEFGVHIFITNHWHLHGNKLCPSPSRSFHLLLWGRVYKANLIKESKITEAKALNLTFRYIDDVLSIQNWISSIYLPILLSKTFWNGNGLLFSRQIQRNHYPYPFCWIITNTDS